MPTGGYLLIQQKVLKAWSAYKQCDNTSLEAGGVILGFRRDPHIEILKITQPQNADIRRRFSFDRNSKVHCNIAITEWKKSNGYVDYLGEWHTHPEHIPYPSVLDLAEMSQITSFQKPKNMLSVIVGIDKLWIGVFTKKAFVSLRPYT